MKWRVPISIQENTAPAVRETNAGELLRNQNLGTPYESYTTARLLIGMCMDHRERLRIPHQSVAVAEFTERRSGHRRGLGGRS